MEALLQVLTLIQFVAQPMLRATQVPKEIVLSGMEFAKNPIVIALFILLQICDVISIQRMNAAMNKKDGKSHKTAEKNWFELLSEGLVIFSQRLATSFIRIPVAFVFVSTVLFLKAISVIFQLSFRRKRTIDPANGPKTTRTRYQGFLA